MRMLCLCGICADAHAQTRTHARTHTHTHTRTPTHTHTHKHTRTHTHTHRGVESVQDACPVREPFSVVGPKHARTYVSTSSCPRVVHVCVRSPGVGAGAEEGGARESQAGAGDKTHRHWGCAGGPGDGGQAETPGKVAHRVERLAGDGAPCRGERDTHTRSLVPRRCRGRAHARRRAHTPSTRTAQLQYPAPGVWSAGIVANG